MRVKITYADLSSREVTIADGPVISMALAAADNEDMVARETAKRKPSKVEALSAALPVVGP